MNKWLNYHHLHYFWMTVKEGGIQPAAKQLRLSHPTVSVQLKQLEEALGEPLFDRSRRRLELTEIGKVAFKYADEIFSLGREMVDVIEGAPAAGRAVRLAVGVTDVIPKLVVRRLLDPALHVPGPVRLLVQEEAHERLLGALATHDLDVLISDQPLPGSSGVRAFNHLLGQCGVTFLAAPGLKKRLKGPFPACLHDAPFIAPLPTTALGRNLNQWFQAQEVSPNLVAEVADSALVKVLAQDGVGAFCLPSVVEEEARRRYQLRVLGRTDEVTERFYAISPERKLKNPAVVAICDAARDEIFSS